ncbi:MAG: OmpA family protein [Leptospiraceae bacterium]|nr:OmpA family protein [Leptospiraceae bacterium]
MSKTKLPTINYWPAFSDVAISLFFIVMVALVFQLMKINFDREIEDEMQKRFYLFQEKMKDQELTRLGMEQGEIKVKRDGFDIKVSFGANVLFDTMQKDLKENGLNLMNAFTKILLQMYNNRNSDILPEIQVEGHTDSKSIAAGYSNLFPSNWELSSARAITVVKFIQTSGIEPDENHKRLLSARGFNAYDYVAKEKDSKGEVVPGSEDLNRRIDIILHYEKEKIKNYLDTKMFNQ